MKKAWIIAFILLLVLALVGCYFQHEGESPPPGPPSPSAPGTTPGANTGSDRTSPSETPEPPEPPAEGGFYEQNVNVTHDGFVYKVNSVTVTKDKAEVSENEPMAKFLSSYKPELDQEVRGAYSYVLINMTIDNVFDKPYATNVRGGKGLVTQGQLPDTYKIPRFLRVFDKTQHPKGLTGSYWDYMLAPGEEMTANYLYIVEDDALKENLYMILWDPTYSSTGNEKGNNYILLHTADQSSLPSPLLTEDAPPPRKPTKEPQPGEYKPEKIKPGQIFQQGEDVEWGNFLYRVNTAEAIADFKGLDWFPLSAYEEHVAFMRSHAPDAEPCVLIVNMTITNTEDTSIEEIPSSSIQTMTGDSTVSGHFGDSRAWDVRPYSSYGKRYSYYNFAPREEIICNFLYIGDIDELGRDFRMKIGYSSSISDNRFINFQVKR